VQEYEELLSSLSVELEQVRGQLAVATRQDPSPEVLKLKCDIIAVKVMSVVIDQLLMAGYRKSVS